MRPRTPARREDGAVAVFTAVATTLLLMFAAFAVDLGNTWARRGELQVQADRAAVYAAQFLPADDDAEKATVAQAVAYYLACHSVTGQRELSPAIPACPTDSDSTTLDSYAASLLSAGTVSFPARNQVRVTTPPAYIDFGFGGVVGKEGSVQQRRATARVSSPGMMSPMALSLDCLLSAATNVVNGGVPFGYISTTHQGGGGPSTATTTTWTNATLPSPDLSGVSPGRVTQQLAGIGVPPTLQVSGSGWPTLGAGESWVVAFAMGTGLLRRAASAAGTVVLAPGPNKRKVGSITVQLPATVIGVSGEWEVKVAKRSASGVVTYSADTSYLNVDPLLSSTNDVACGRLIKSPRAGTQANVNFVLNLQEGIDHLISQYPSILSTGTLDLAQLQSLVSLTECGGSGAVKDTNGQGGGQTPNCVVTNMSNAYEAGFTEGMIGTNGRLRCTTARPCRKSFDLGGRSVNDDSFSDYVKDTSLLTSATFFNTDTYLTSGLPVVTPTSNLDRDIYDSHRFMWVAVISTAGAVSQVQAGDYPVLTFRPIFVTQAEALDTLPLLNAGDLLGGFGLAPLLTAVQAVDGMMQTVLQPGLVDQHGLLMDGDELSAIRFMTVSPDALPAVPADYAGPESEYLGVGPRIIRLVE